MDTTGKTIWITKVPVWGLEPAASFPVWRETPTLTPAGLHHIVSHIPPGKSPTGKELLSIFFTVFLKDNELVCKMSLTWKKYALSAGSFSKLWTSAINVYSIVFTSASELCHRWIESLHYCWLLSVFMRNNVIKLTSEVIGSCSK